MKLSTNDRGGANGADQSQVGAWSWSSSELVTYVAK